MGTCIGGGALSGYLPSGAWDSLISKPQLFRSASFTGPVAVYRGPRCGGDPGTMVNPALETCLADANVALSRWMS